MDVNDDAPGLMRNVPSRQKLQSLRWIYDLARICADGMSDEHSNCPKSTENPAPLRLIDLSSGGDTLRLMKKQGMVLKYAALSYCWGSCKASGTRKSNLAERMLAFELSSLPQTLQDSIVIARKLEVPGWKMMDYYANAYLTIVPVSCDSAEQSCLGQQRWVTDQLSGLWVGKPERLLHFNHPVWELVSKEVDKSAWAKRAWAFQERQLSARIVFFGRNGIRFECREGAFDKYNCNESSPIKPDIFLPVPNTPSPEWDALWKIRAKWYNMVSDYVERQLAFESDRLIALSGVVQKFEILFHGKDEYMSGFWKNDLCQGLCWDFSTGFKRLPGEDALFQSCFADSLSLVKSQLFPSWSWCCMRRPVEWDDVAGSIPSAQLLEAIKPLNGADFAIQGKAVKLVLEAWMFPADILDRTLSEDLEVSVRLDARDKPTINPRTLAKYSAIPLLVGLYGADEAQWRASRTTILHKVYGLIIQKANSQHGGNEEYERMGMFKVLSSRH
ncbi:hypothetical protein H2200_003380 [Cladophialophora chaetospira]|uniref:Heterokaryon incompatibility domain-containing protein n=1 Tax=Cladophialophora chaetospira TaxID=386627 RepID=A0AA38XH85_9EURO|nr:hypothetical protein H2200_003380 [Cladophialophora chaetospira]